MTIDKILKDAETIEKTEIGELLTDMLADDKKSIDIARVLLTKIMIQDDEYTDLTDRQIIHLAILEGILKIMPSPFLAQLILSFKRLRKSHKRKDRQEAVKMVQSLREEQEGIQSKLKNLLGVGG